MYKLSLFLKRILFYEKPIRVALLKLLSLKLKTFRPHYEAVLYESCLEAKKLGLSRISVIELGVAGGNGIISLERYKKKIEQVLDIKIDIFGFDHGKGLPSTKLKEDIPWIWKEGDFQIDVTKLESQISSKIFYGDIAETINDFIKLKPYKIGCIFFDMDLYSSTKSFLKKVPEISNFLMPRVLCYFDDLYVRNYISEFNGELKAIKEFNEENTDFKLGNNIDHPESYRFPLANRLVYTLHSFNNDEYYKYIGSSEPQSHQLGTKSKVWTPFS